MFVVRPITADDIDAMFVFSRAASFGIANLPTYPPRMERMLQDGINAFNKHVTEPHNEIYPFILENYITGEKAGTSSILAKAGARSPYCTFYIENLPEGEAYPPEGCQHALLYPRYYGYEGPSELCALYLLPQYRKGGLGKLLSLSRLLFIATHPQRFTDTLFADLRGYITPEGRNPFWEAVGEKLWGFTYLEAIQKLDREEINLCTFLPHYPIHWCLLPKEVQKYIGKTHPNTQAAYHLLNSQGLFYQKEISILDGGPLVTAAIQSIKVIAKCKDAAITSIVDEIETPGIEVLACTVGSPFRVCQTRIVYQDHTATIDQLTANALQVAVNNAIKFYIL